MDRGDRLLNEIILSNLNKDSFKENLEELRYVRMLSNDYQRESNLNKLLNLRDKVKKRDLIKRDDRRRLQRLRLWARENAGILSAVLISSSAVIIGLVASTRNILWKVGDTTEKLDKRISESVVTFNPTTISPGEELYINIPKLKPDSCLVPGSFALLFDFKNSNTKSRFNNNLSKLIAKRLQIKVAGETAYGCSGESLYEIYKDLWLTLGDRKKMTEQGLQARILGS
ncbi:Hypothetical predicted protein [Paramuricea clavata]|uniref:Uncharacterized protein n=1 Tax=Paramuricea clavata TaxID=317549 RepID=A0A7D9E243_PARCT|nr:Hypothetical predicted protein [Paramuricea clavata]